MPPKRQKAPKPTRFKPMNKRTPREERDRREAEANGSSSAGTALPPSAAGDASTTTPAINTTSTPSLEVEAAISAGEQCPTSTPGEIGLGAVAGDVLEAIEAGEKLAGNGSVKHKSAATPEVTAKISKAADDLAAVAQNGKDDGSKTAATESNSSPASANKADGSKSTAANEEVLESAKDDEATPVDEHLPTAAQDVAPAEVVSNPSVLVEELPESAKGIETTTPSFKESPAPATQKSSSVSPLKHPREPSLLDSSRPGKKRNMGAESGVDGV